MPFNAFKEEFPLDWFPHAVSTGPAPAGLLSGLQQALLSLNALALTKMAPPLLTETDPLGGECLFSFQGGGSGWGGRLMKIPLPCLDNLRPLR